MDKRKVSTAHASRSIGIAVVSAALLTLIACSSVGPATVPRDQFDYNGAIANASQEQLLMNLVRLRYSETPTFLRVSSVISQYTRAGNVSAGVGANTAATGDNTATLGGLVRWSDRPVISYTPVAGQEFAKDLLKPVSPFQLFEMMQSGWPAELVLRTSMVSINGVSNHNTRPSDRREADPDFFELYKLWQKLGRAYILSLRVSTDVDGKDRMFMDIDPAQAPELGPELQRFREILGLDPGREEFVIVRGKLPEQDQLAVLTGSIWDIMLRIAWQFEAPPEHIESGRTGANFASNNPNYVRPIVVLHSEERPEHAFVSVFTQDYWFYIDRNDRHSKRIFSFLELMLTLTQSDLQGVAPVMTISN